jgi:DNA-binding CsgD family transcriptional regulator
MFQVVMPAFSNVGLLADWYWAVPYIAAVLIVKRLPARLNKSYILYAAIAMLGFAFIAFMTLDRSALSYLIINTLLLGACGINDLFWWTILGDLLDFHRNPAKILGIGLGTNVAGVLIGEFIGAFHTPSAPSGAAALTGMAVVCVALVLLPPLHRQLSLVLKNNSFLAELSTLPPQEQAKTVSDAVRIAELTERENEIAVLLLKGWPYKLIAAALFISESTVKTHVQSIYLKLNIHSRTELIQKISLNG